MDFTTVTETAGTRITREAILMMRTRYAYAAGFCAGKDVLEVGCGCGQALGYLARRSRRVGGGDCTLHLLRLARRHYGPAMPLVQLTAERLPFRDRAFDVVIFYEGIYYLSRPGLFLEECRRVLRGRGVLLLSMVNPAWKDFNPSPLSTRYFSAEELAALLRGHGYEMELLGAFPPRPASPRETIVSVIRRTAIALHLIPRTMRAKEFLKRLFLGKLETMPPELEMESGTLSSPRPLSPAASPAGYKVLYAVGRPGPGCGEISSASEGLDDPDRLTPRAPPPPAGPSGGGRRPLPRPSPPA